MTAVQRPRALLDTWRDPEVRPVMSAAITLSMAVGVFGMSFGVGSVSAGVSVAKTCVLSLLVFTGASQFSAVSVIGAGGSSASAFGSAMLLAARNGVYGLTMARRLPLSRWSTRLVAAQLTIDETTAMAVAQSEARLQRVAFWTTGIALYTCWNLGTLIGALLGSSVDPKTFGLDAAFPAGFVAMVWPMLRTPRGRWAGSIGAGLCLVTVPFLPVGVPILCAATGVLVGWPETWRGEPTQAPAAADGDVGG
jgi:4-azaleucine resistance transporter AzlC